MILALGDYSGPTPVYDYHGNLVDPNTPATAADCLPFACGAQASNLNARLWCAFWGQARALSPCTDPSCAPFRPNYCTPAASSAPVVTVAAPAGGGGAAGTGSSSSAGGGGGGVAIATTTVETSAGPIEVPAASLPAVSDVTLTPAMVRLPSVWDSLDPSKASPFEYRGISTSFPPWISQEYRDSLAPAPAAPEVPQFGGVPWWVWLAIAGALFLFADHKRRRAPRKRLTHG